MNEQLHPRSILELPDDDGGMAAIQAFGRSNSPPAGLYDSAILQAARDELLAGFEAEERRNILDPFAPAGERNTQVITVLRNAITRHRRNGGALAHISDDAETLLAIFAATLGWGPAQRYLDDPRVNEVKINGCVIMVQEAGRPFVIAAERFNQPAEVRDRTLQLASALGIVLDASHPQETIPVAHGTRLHATIYPRITEKDGALVCIRRGRREAWDLEDVLARATIDQTGMELLLLLCQARCSFLIAGRTGSGKTGLLEALANSWPGDPHIISIEDHTLEIGIRSTATWTRELVDTQRDQHAFGRVAREALRQTPGLLLPGEVRSSEAGAILFLALSGHPVITSLHARTSLEAVARFAGYAAQPGAYIYEGRHQDAMRDTCTAFDIVVAMDILDAEGRRLVAEICLLDGWRDEHGTVQPICLPLLTVQYDASGAIHWQAHARAGADGLLIWADDIDQTPARLRDALMRRKRHMAKPGAATIDTLPAMLAQAERLLAAGESERALSTLRSIWAIQPDRRALDLAQRLIDQQPSRFHQLHVDAHSQRDLLAAMIVERRWADAQALYNAQVADISGSAAAALVDGWNELATRLRAGAAQEEQAVRLRTAAITALRQNQPRTALDLLNPLTTYESILSPDLTRDILDVREAALTELLARGEASPAALRLVRERRQALGDKE